MSNELIQPATGVIVRVDTTIVLTTATALAIDVRKPSGALTTWVGYINATVDTKIDYVLQALDLDEVGKYTCCANVSFPGAPNVYGKPFLITVKPKFE
jgi:hypothetical protein